MVDKTNGSPSSKAPGGMTKKEAVEKGLATLGSSATPTQLKKHIWDRFHIEMDLNHISTAKAKILKAAGEHKPAAAKPAARTSPAALPVSQKAGIRKETTAKPAIPHSNAAHGISLKDIETVKELVERLGANSLKKLIDVMAR
ncbi:MAG TPA: hypothetical protein VMG10_35245 [Gemmataceae bacterium]|nr:hypothetical protein [Gemmataceae bacterium]